MFHHVERQAHCRKQVTSAHGECRQTGVQPVEGANQRDAGSGYSAQVGGTHSKAAWLIVSVNLDHKARVLLINGEGTLPALDDMDV